MRRFAIAALALSAVAALSIADSADDTNKFGWGENIGWTNWADAGDGLQAACLDMDHLEGFVWGENIGFINLGNGAGPYANMDDQDFGVNVDPMTGECSGFAWAENVGWLNFSTTATQGAQGARYDFANDRFRGYVWGENIGWINLDDGTHFVSLGAGAGCVGDCDGNGTVAFNDLVSMLFEFGGDGGGFGCDADMNGTVEFNDLVTALFLFGPCP